MGTDDPKQERLDGLRRRAEQRVAREQRQESEPFSESELIHLVHELQVHQIELQVQNEELERARTEADAVRERYFELYDLAPIGYLTLDVDGRVVEANLAAAIMLGTERMRLVGAQFAFFVAAQAHERLRRFVQTVLVSDVKQRLDAILVREDGPQFHARIEGAASPDRPECRVALIDMTERVQAEATLREHLALLQRALAPAKPTTIEGYEVAAEYVPGVTGQEIGGDFYDVFLTESGSAAFLIGDVSGKGVKAAALAAAARSTIHAFAYEMPDPAEALNHTNTVLFSHESHSGDFVTACLIVIEPETGSFVYSRAGHPPAAVCRGNGKVELLMPGDPPIGLSETQLFHSYEGQLGPGERIVLYTDGILDARRGPELFDLEGLDRILTGRCYLPVHIVCSSLVKAATDWAEGKPQDDIAVLGVERLATPT